MHMWHGEQIDKVHVDGYNYSNRGLETYCRVQCNNCKNYNENQSHNDEEGVDPTVMSRRGKPVEEKSG